MQQVLVVVDMQEIFFTENQNLIYEYEKLVQHVNTVIDWARNNQIPVVFIQHTDTDPSDEMAKDKPGWYLHKGLNRTNTDKVIQKFTWDAFYNTELGEYLKVLETEQIIFVGAQTEFCLDTTMRSAYSHGYHNNILVEGTNSTLDSAVLKAEQIIKHHEIVCNKRFVPIQPLGNY